MSVASDILCVCEQESLSLSLSNQTLLCQVFLSGRVIPPAAGRGGGGGGGGGNARQLLHRLHLILQTITTAGETGDI